MPITMPEVPPAPTTVEAFRANVVRKLQVAVGKDAPHARPRDWYVATALEIVKYRHLRRLGLARGGAADGDDPVPRPFARGRS